MECDVEKHLPYASIPTWDCAPYTRDLDQADIVIMGIPFDGGVTFRLAPGSVREPFATEPDYKYF